MSAVKHTPGPWFADSGGKVWRRPPADLYENGGGVAGDFSIASASEGGPDWENKFPAEANARLIAAAPELLDVLRMSAEALESASRAIGGGLGVVVADRAMFARAAIAKATGGAA